MASFKIYCKRLPNAFSKNSTMNFFTAIVFTSVNFEDSLIMNKTTEILFLLISRPNMLFRTGLEESVSRHFFAAL